MRSEVKVIAHAGYAALYSSICEYATKDDKSLPALVYGVHHLVDQISITETITVPTAAADIHGEAISTAAGVNGEISAEMSNALKRSASWRKGERQRI